MSLLSRYESLRRKELEGLTKLVDALGRVDGLPAEKLSQARDALFHADHPFLIVLLGGFNTGKSSLLNALIGDRALGVGPTPTTDRIIVLRHGASFQRQMTGDTDTVFHPSRLLEQVSLVDTPGLESVFTGHDAITQRFLHRADAVFLVMLATQAMSGANAAYLESMRAYGKRIIILINQIDLLDDAERAQITAFVTSEARKILELEPTVWLVSAKWAEQAQPPSPNMPRDAALWEKSGFGTIERFILQTLDDAERVRGKLETPLQIGRSVTTNALELVTDAQNSLAVYRKSAETVKAQIEQGIADQRETVETTATAIGGVFDQVSARGQQAIRDTFQLNRAARLAGGGIFELTGLARIGRRLGGQTATKSAFETLQVLEPLDRLPSLVEAIGPRLEGRDLRDTDDLANYTKKELAAFPDWLQNKLVGTIQAPQEYKRTIIPAAQMALDQTAKTTGAAEFGRIDRAVQSTVIVLAFFEIVVFILGIVFAASFGSSTNSGQWILLVLITLLVMALGLFAIPLRGSTMARAFAERVTTAKKTYLQTLHAAAENQIDYGRQLRAETVRPFLRLVETQTGQADAIKAELENGRRTLETLEQELTTLQK